MIDNVPKSDMGETSDEHRYYAFPFLTVFEGALYILDKMGYQLLFSNIYMGRIIVTFERGRHALGRMDIKFVGRGKATFVHVDSPRYSMTGADFMDGAKQRFFCRLDDWLHQASPNEVLWVHKRAIPSYGSPDIAYVPKGIG